MSSVHEGEGCNKVYPSRREPVEDLTWSPEREPSAHSPAEEEHEEYVGDEEDGEKEEEEGEEGERGRRRRGRGKRWPKGHAEATRL